MTKLGAFVRENERPGRRVAELTFDAVVRPRVAAGVLLPRLEARARAAGASEALLARAAQLTETLGVRSSIATYRLLAAVASGNKSAMTPLLNKFQPDIPDQLMWDALELGGYDVEQVRHDDAADLVAFFEPEIRRGFVNDGFSQVFEWLLTNQRVPSESPALRPLLEALVTSAVERREQTEAENQLFSDATLRAVAADLFAQEGPPSCFLSGASLLAAAHPDVERARFGNIEFSTFGGVDGLVAGLPSAFTLVSRRGDHVVVRHTPTDALATVVCCRVDGGRLSHGDGRYTRWYTPFEVAAHDFGIGTFPGPSDTDRYLDERFGQWRTAPFFYDAVLDAPNTTIDRSLDGLLYVYSKMRDTFATGRRHYADEWSAIMRDRFGIEYSNFVPRGVPRKVLATPLTEREVDGRPIHLVVAAFDAVDAQFITWLDEQTSDGVFVVAGVVGHRLDGDANERLALANSLASVDHATLIETPDDLAEPIPGFAVATTTVHASIEMPVKR
ncbi:hypothetical protein [Ilumatobacter coccineus]|uniref:Uncharacterized protein n=1 Tax=Ilumatobacter coccineus (strain NBRC 103263 / KCTC 29153 / YM16-304) TaxID=1313172 RepID=A0A6C7EFD8_ILUCY|nr:hypothetical protein [Ilumatobacter coccineus]BAN03328.1 hypothetical protein YM304_30140 [Ilumatobacter coccineus YM16-304]